MKKHLNQGHDTGQCAGMRLFTGRCTTMRLSDQAERLVVRLMAAVLAFLALVGFIIWNGTGRTTLNRIAAPTGIMMPFEKAPEPDPIAVPVQDSQSDTIRISAA